MKPDHDQDDTRRQLEGSLSSKGLPLARGVVGTSFFDWLWGLQRDFGFKFLVFLFVTQHFMKGFMTYFTMHSHNYLYRAHGLGAPRIQVLNGVIRTPYVLRPMVALVSDVFPILGYRKSPYMAAASVVGVIGLMVVGLVPRACLSTYGLVFGMFLQNVQYATCDLLSDALYTIKMRQQPAKATDLVTFIWMGQDAFALVGTLASGIAIAEYGPEAVNTLTILPAIVVLWVVLRNYAQEVPVSLENSRDMRQKYFDQESEVSTLCFLICGMGMVIMIVALTFKSTMVNLIVSSCACFCVIVCFGLLLSPTIAMFLIFGMLSKAFHLNFEEAAYYFMTDTPEQFPEGPHFNEFFYVSVRGSAICICSLFGAWTYKRYLQHYSFRSVIIITTIAISCIHLTSLLFVTRTNVKLGIHDQFFVLCGEVTHICQQWHGMLFMIILARLCPPGMQATLIALGGGSHVLGAAVSKSAAACLLGVFGVRPNGSDTESEQFKHLWCCVLIGALVPLVFVACCIRLVPAEADIDAVDAVGGYTATGGSFWQRWGGGGNARALVEKSVP